LQPAVALCDVTIYDEALIGPLEIRFSQQPFRASSASVRATDPGATIAVGKPIFFFGEADVGWQEQSLSLCVRGT
jgi:hypothetical protein